MDVSGLYSTSTILPVQGVRYGKHFSALSTSNSLGDTVSISSDAMEKYMALKNKSEEEKEIEKNMTTWFEVVHGGFCAPKTDYSKWSTENLEQKQEIEAKIDAILAEERNGLKPLSQETLDKLEPLWAKLDVLDALADKMHVTDDIMEKATTVLGKLKADWDAAHPEKSLLRSAIDSWQTIDPEKLEEEIRKRKDETLAGATDGSEDTAEEEAA